VFEKIRVQRILIESEQHFRTVTNTGSALIWTSGIDMLCDYFNETWLKFTGRALSAEMGNGWLEGVHPEDFDRCMEIYTTAFGHREPFSMEYRLRKADGSYCWIVDHGNPRFDSEGNFIGYVGHCYDISERKKTDEKLQYIAHYDALTGLPNRVLLSDRLQQAIAQASRNHSTIAVVYLDLDGFKEINDQYGHKMGDILLSMLAGRMKQSLREGDTIARLGGDEFVAILLDLKDHEDCVPMLIRLLSATSQNVLIDSITINVSASLGVSFFDEENSLDADQLLRQADQAMYQAKLSGKNRYHIFDAAQDRTIRTYHESLDAIENALIHNEFILYYQPKVNMHTGKVIGAEALIRWNHPQKGILPPATFLSTIEEHPLSIKIGFWVIEQAIRQVRDFKSQGLSIPISVNVNALQLQQEDFLQNLQTILLRYPELKYGDLEFEILETSALQDIEYISTIIKECQKIGIYFSLDDFGTGYSSLTYLKRLNAKILKIDQSFVQGMLNDPDDLAILDGIIGLSVAFRRDVIAEGVESIEHGEMLIRLGCFNAQGYIIAKPMPPEALPEWVDHWKPDRKWLRTNRIRRDNIPLLFAAVEHKSWLTKVIAYLNNERQELVPLDSTQCHFGLWIDEHGDTQYGGYLFFPEIKQVHEEIHHIAQKLIGQKNSANATHFQKSIDELLQKSDHLMNLLKQLEN
jgi:diguanylate cyclase (GGDEF)-like protein/PAS domain S-box-containing protein